MGGISVMRYMEAFSFGQSEVSSFGELGCDLASKEEQAKNYGYVNAWRLSNFA